MRRRKITLILALVITASIVVWGILKWQQQQPIRITTRVASDSGLRVIVPLQSTSGTVTLQPEYIAEKKLVTATYTIDNTTITLSQQAKPKDTPLDQIDTAEKFITQLGTVYVLKSKPGIRQSIIETIDSWVYVTANDTVSYDSYKQFILHLTTASS